jgi:hypothetical protein
MLVLRREELKEKLARGIAADETYQQHVGRCKELADTLDKINQQIRSINGGDDDDASKFKERPSSSGYA